VPGCSAGTGGGYQDKNPYWYKFTCFQSGTLGFLISPVNQGDDYDWQLYDITNRNPDDVFTDQSLIVTGNWAGTFGNTGASSSGVNFIQCGSDPSQNKNTFLFFSVLDFIVNNSQLLLSTNTYNYYYWLQNINAENNIEDRNYNSSGNQTISINKNFIDNSNVVILGAWTPINNSISLEHLKGEEQKNAIYSLLKQGFSEYYFSMNNFEDSQSTKLTEELLKAAEQTNLKIIIILLPTSEGDSNTNYDWKGWIKYFNSLKKKYPKSFEGFTIDDFNWKSTREETKFKLNIDFMEYSKLIKTLEDKDKDVKFYPTIYFEGKRNDKVANIYNDYIDGLIVASGCYYNVSTLKKEFIIFREIFEKPIRYVVYPTMTYNYSRQGYNPPTDRLIQATLSIASTSADGLIIWRDIDKPVIQEYLNNQDNNKQYLAKISKMKELQINDEKITTTANSKKKLLNIPDAEQYFNCQEWSNRYNKAYDKLKDLPQQEKEKNKWKNEILQIIRKDK